MTKTVVIFNAAINSGKDVCAKLMKDYFRSGEIFSFKDSLYLDVAKHFNISVDDLKTHHNNRDLKEIPNLMFPKYQDKVFKQYFFWLLYLLGILLNNRYLMSLGYYSSRGALIHVSEDLVKPVKGKSYYGELLASKINDSVSRFFFVPDSGYKDEATPLLDNGYDVYIVHLERNSATFENDSRKLLTEDDFKGEDGSVLYNNLKFIKMYNNGSLDDLYKTITDFSFDLVLNQTLDHYGGNEDGNEIVEYEVVYE